MSIRNYKILYNSNYAAGFFHGLSVGVILTFIGCLLVIYAMDDHSEPSKNCRETVAVDSTVVYTDQIMK
jgi:hypothetical protein